MRLRVPLAPLASVLLFAGLCAICAAWALALLAPRSPVTPAGTIAQSGAPVDLRQASGLFGAQATQEVSAAAVGPADIQVVGVMAAGSRGVALLAVNGRPAKPFAVGESVDAETTVAAVSADAVTLERRGQRVKAPAPKRPDLAVLTSGPATGATAPGTAPQAPPNAVIGSLPAPGVPGAGPITPGGGRPLNMPPAPPAPPAPALAPTDPPLPQQDPMPPGAAVMPGTGLPGVTIRP
jgi:general secretion pathway protein C